MARVSGVVLLPLDSRNDGGSGGNDSRGDIGEGEVGGDPSTSNANIITHCIHT